MLTCRCCCCCCCSCCSHRRRCRWVKCPPCIFMLDCVLWADVARLSHPLFVACQRVPRNGRDAASGGRGRCGKGNWLHHKYCGLFSHVRVGGTPCTHRQATYPERFLDCRFSCGTPTPPLLSPLPLVLQLWQAVVAAAAAAAFVCCSCIFYVATGLLK